MHLYTAQPHPWLRAVLWMTWHETLSLQEKQVRGLGPDGEISTHSASSQGKWVPGYAQATRLKGNIPRARGHYIEAHKGQISRSVS